MFNRITNYGNLEQVRLWDGCLSYWKLDETSGTVAYDSVGAVNGVVTTGAFDSGGKNNYSWKRANKTGVGINLGDNYAFEYNQPFSINMWVKWSELNAWSLFFSKENASTYKGYGLFKNNSNQVYCEIRGSQLIQNTNTGTTITSTSNWYMITLTYNGSGANTGAIVYVNAIGTGQKRVGSISDSMVTTQSLTLGSYAADLNSGLYGYMDEVAVWNRALNEAEIKALYSGGNGKFYGTKTINWSGLQSYYRLDETSGTTAYDSVGAINGTISNATVNQYGKQGKAILFNSTNSKVELANNTIYNFERTDSFSISCWIKRTNIGGAAPFIYSKSIASGNYNGHSSYFMSDGRISFYLVNTPTNRVGVITSNTITDTNWHNIIYTYNGSSNISGVKVYIDGIECTYGTTHNTLTASIQSTATFQIGNRNTALGADATIDEFAIWNRPLLPYEIKDLYNAGAGKFY